MEAIPSLMLQSCHIIHQKETLQKPYLIGQVVGKQGLIAYNYLDGTSLLHDLRQQKDLVRLRGQIIAIDQDQKPFKVTGISDHEGFTWTLGEGKAYYHPIDSKWSATSTLSNDRHQYHSKTGVLVKMRNKANDQDNREAFILDFASGKIIQHSTSRQDFTENCLILISPDGKTVYYNANFIKTDVGETQEVSMDKEFSEESNLKERNSPHSIIQYQLPDSQTIKKELKNIPINVNYLNLNVRTWANPINVYSLI